jgi:hypothetical protein
LKKNSRIGFLETKNFTKKNPLTRRIITQPHKFRPTTTQRTGKRDFLSVDGGLRLIDSRNKKKKRVPVYAFRETNIFVFIFFINKNP